jgi:WD40 repeat protein
MVFAVVTTTAVVIYDTQHFYPLARIDGCHLATINDIAWSSNGQTLVFCSSDGYVTFARFNSDVLGELSFSLSLSLSHTLTLADVLQGVPIPLEKVPSEVKNAFSSVYLPPQIDLPLPPTTPSSFQPMKEEQGCPMKEGLKRSREENCSEVAPTALSSYATAAAPAPADSTGDAAKSKKKRITPVLSQSPISPCSLFGKEGDQLSGLIPIDLTSGDSNPGLPSKTEEAPSLQLDVRSESGKVKKRITPVAGPLPVPPIGDAVSPPQTEP